METGDWRLKQLPNLRPNVIDKIVDRLKMVACISKPEDENKLRAMVAGFEEDLYNTSPSEVHYAERLRVKTQVIENKIAERTANSSAIGGQNTSRQAMSLQQNQGQQLLPLKTVDQSQAQQHSFFQNIIPSTVHNSATFSAIRSLNTGSTKTGMVMSPMTMVNKAHAHPQTLPQKIIPSTNFVGQNANLLSNIGGIKHNSESNSFPVRGVQPYVLSNTQGQHQPQGSHEQSQNLQQLLSMYQLQHSSNQFVKQHQENMQSSMLQHLQQPASSLRYKQLQQASSSVTVTGEQDQERQLAHHTRMQQAGVAYQQKSNQQISSTVLALQANSASTHSRIQTPTSLTHSRIQTPSHSHHELSTSDQQDQCLFQAQTGLPGPALSELQASNAVTTLTDQKETIRREQCYQKLQLLKNKHFRVIHEIYKKLIANCEREQKREALEYRNRWKKATEHILKFFNSPKSSIEANFEENFAVCQKLIVSVLTAAKGGTRSGQQPEQLRSKQSSPTTSISTPLTTTMCMQRFPLPAQSLDPAYGNAAVSSPANAMNSLQQNIVNKTQQGRLNALAPNMNTYQLNAGMLQKHPQKQQPEQDWKRQLFLGYPQSKQQLDLDQQGQPIQKMPQNHQASNYVNELANSQRLPQSKLMPQHHHQSNQVNASLEQSSEKSQQLVRQDVQQDLAVAAGIADSPTTVLSPVFVEIETPKQDPFDQLIKTIKSMSPERFRSRASEIRSAVMGQAPGGECGSNVGEDLTAITDHKVRAEDSPDESPPVAKKMKLEFDSTPLNVPSVNHSLIEEVKEINLSLLETAVEIIDEDDDSVAEALYGKGTVVKCTYTAVTISCELKSQLAAAQMEPKMTLKLLVPTNYPSCFPVPLDELPAETSKEVVDIFVKAKYQFGVALAASAQSMPLRKIASTWDACARQVIIEFADRTGGGTFSSRFGIWKKY